MAAGHALYRDDKLRLPTLSLGLSSVRFIVNQIEDECTRVIASDILENGRELVKFGPTIDEGYDDYQDFPLGPPAPRGRVWTRIAVNFAVALSKCIPSVTFANFGILAVTIGLFAPKMISYLVVYPFCRLVFGTLYPAYASYKAVRTKNLKEYVKWMMYWIVFALFTCTETFTDVFLSWFPFYYEVKIVLVLWLLSPATKGSSILYRKFVHPALCRREQEIDEYIAKAKDQGYHTVLNLGTKGVNYATTVIMQTAIKGGGGLVQQLRKSYSLSDLTECEPREEHPGDEADDVLAEPRLIRRVAKSGYNTRRSASESNSRSPMYFPEVDVDVRGTRASRTDEPDFSHIKSSEDISSGYSSADNSASLTRTASLGASARARARTTRTTVTTIKRPQAAEDSEVIIEELHDDDSFEYANMPPLVNLPSPIFLSQTDPPFIYQYVGDQIRILQVLGNDPINPKLNIENNNTDYRDQTKTSTQEAKQDVDIDVKDNSNETNNVQETTISENLILSTDIPLKAKNDNNNIYNVANDSNVQLPVEEDTSKEIFEETIDNNAKEEYINIQKPLNVVSDTETTSLDTSINENYSAESDDEASFGTPEDSPKAKRKSPKGKYGKEKAPPPPKLDVLKDVTKPDNQSVDSLITTSQESLNIIVNQMPDITNKDTDLSKTSLQVVNPIAENKRRHKSKSPGRIPKSHGSGISKLLQLPSKLAFWHKSEEKQKSDIVSTSSDDHSRRSSTIENQVDDFQSCVDLNALANTAKDVSTLFQFEPEDDFFKDATDIDAEIISNDIIEKSDALQKLIDAKIESHPEYKYVSLHEEIPTTSKSTDV